MIVQILLLLLAFMYGWIIYRLFNTSTNNYIEGYKKVTVGVMGASFLGIIFYLPYYANYFQNCSLIPLFVLSVFYLFLFVVYTFMYKFRSTYYEKKRLYFAVFDYRYIFSMSGNILFQELGILIALLLLKNIGLSGFELSILFGIIAMITHGYIIRKNLGTGIYFIFSSFLAGLIFPIIIFGYPLGIVYTFIIHWIFYLLTGLALRFNFIKI